MSVSYIILYGYDKNTFIKYTNQGINKILLLEPRSQYIDLFNKDKLQFKNYKFRN